MSQSKSPFDALLGEVVKAGKRAARGAIRGAVAESRKTVQEIDRRIQDAIGSPEDDGQTIDVVEVREVPSKPRRGARSCAGSADEGDD